MKKPFFNIICCSADSTINEALGSLITALNYNPILLDNYEAIIEKIRKEEITAILVDESINHEGEKGNIYNIFKNYRYKVPIIFLLETVNGIQEYHPYKQYLKKPINVITLKNYLSPYLQDKNLIKTSPILKIGNFDFDKNLNYLIDEKKNKIELTHLESLLLLTFFENLNKVLSEEFLLKNVWGYSAGANSNTIKTHIWRLRKKVSKKSSASFYLETTNKGYIFKN